MIGLTARQRDCLVAIAAFRARYRIGPSFDDLRWNLGLRSKESVARLTLGLVERGMIHPPRNRPRVLALTESGKAMLRRTTAMRGNEPLRFIQIPDAKHTETHVNRHPDLSTHLAAPQCAGRKSQGLPYD